MRKFFQCCVRHLPLVVACSLLATANHLSNTARISEYNRLEAKVDALAEAVGGEFVVVLEGEK